MIVYDKEQKEIVIPNGIGNINLFNNGVEAGYNQGKTDGIDEQKSKLESINITENGTYSREDGYNEIVVDVPDLNGSYDEGYEQGRTEGYNEGKADGINEQKGKLSQITISENGTYAKEDGYNKVIVNVPDLNGDYNEGYEQGKADGVNEQKSKLESISITENGTYDRENGYNHIEVNVPDLNGSYNEGYKQGQADLAANARVLNVTENGVYKSKYSDPIVPDTYTVTGVYADGTNFYSYAELNGKVFNTKIAATIDNRLEFWYKGDNASAGSGSNFIIGAGDNLNNVFEIKYYITSNNILIISIGNSSINISNWDDTVWHHLIISKAEGLWIDGEKKRDFSPTNTVNGEFFINGIGYNKDGSRSANGTFGMIKIDDVIIIPTADGFLNTNTGELLEVVQDGGYNFTENLPTYPEDGGELFKTINVNVPDLNGSYEEGYNQGKIDGANEQKGKLESINITENGTYRKEDGYNKVVVNVPDLNGSYDEGYNQGKIDGVNEQKSKLESISITENGTYDREDGYNHIEVNVNAVPKINVKEAKLKFGSSTFKEVPEWADFKGVYEMNSMFKDCTYLQTISQLDTSNVTNMNSMFNSCQSLQTIPQLDTSKVNSMSSMFSNCSSLQTIPQLDTSNVTNMDNMFYNCPNLQTIPQLDTSNVNSMSAMFYACSKLTSLPAFNAQNLSMTPYSGIFGYSELSKLTDFGGLLNLKCSLTSNYTFAKLPNLTKESCINVLNGLYDFVAAGETPSSDQGKLKVHPNFLTTVGEEISIGTNKGWQITA